MLVLREFEVLENDTGVHLDKFVAHRCGISRRVARQWIRTGRVLLNGKPLRVMQKPLRRGQHIRVASEQIAEARPQSVSSIRAQIIYMDRLMVVVDKPAGLLSETDRHGGPSLESVVPRLLEQAGETPSSATLVHRLDAGTSGLIVLARRHSEVRRLNTAFRERAVGKTYLALMRGRFDRNQDVSAPISKGKGTQHRVHPSGRPARTRFISLAANPQASLVEADLFTGRTHQIRVHASHLGHPLMGDRLYGGPGYTDLVPPRPIARPMLHAWQLELPMAGGGRRTFESRPAQDFRDLALEHGLLHPAITEN